MPSHAANPPDFRTLLTRLATMLACRRIRGVLLAAMLGRAHEEPAV